MKKGKLTDTDLMNWWLEKYHNTDIDEVLKKHPEWGDSPLSSREFFREYAVTQEQHDEWYEWMIKTLMAHYKIGKELALRGSMAVYFNIEPLVIADDGGTTDATTSVAGWYSDSSGTYYMDEDGNRHYK